MATGDPPSCQWLPTGRFSSLDDPAPDGIRSRPCPTGEVRVTEVGELPQQVGDLFHVAHKIASGQVKVTDRVIEVCPLSPTPCDRSEAGVKFTSCLQTCCAFAARDRRRDVLDDGGGVLE